jgi:hypothetical protein
LDSPDWFAVTFDGSTNPYLSIALTGETGVVFTVYIDCAGDLALGQYGLYTAGVSTTNLASTGTYYIEVFVVPTGTSAGTYVLTLSD